MSTNHEESDRELSFFGQNDLKMLYFHEKILKFTLVKLHDFKEGDVFFDSGAIL